MLKYITSLIPPFARTLTKRTRTSCWLNLMRDGMLQLAFCIPCDHIGSTTRLNSHLTKHKRTDLYASNIGELT